MGATTSKQEEREEVSHYNEFRMQLTDDDRKLLAASPVDDNGIIHLRSDMTRDVLMTYDSPHSVAFNAFHDTFYQLRIANLDRLGELQREYKTNDSVEKVDMADITDWFPLFVNAADISRVHITITTSLNTVKLHRQLRFLFYLGFSSGSLLKQIVVTFDTPMRYLIESYINDAKRDARRMPMTTYIGKVGMPFRDFNKLTGWVMSERASPITTLWTYNFSFMSLA